MCFFFQSSFFGVFICPMIRGCLIGYGVYRKPDKFLLKTYAILEMTTVSLPICDSLKNQRTHYNFYQKMFSKYLPWESLYNVSRYCAEQNINVILT